MLFLMAGFEIDPGALRGKPIHRAVMGSDRKRRSGAAFRDRRRRGSRNVRARARRHGNRRLDACASGQRPAPAPHMAPWFWREGRWRSCAGDCAVIASGQGQRAPPIAYHDRLRRRHAGRRLARRPRAAANFRPSFCPHHEDVRPVSDASGPLPSDCVGARQRSDFISNSSSAGLQQAQSCARRCRMRSGKTSECDWTGSARRFLCPSSLLLRVLGSMWRRFSPVLPLWPWFRSRRSSCLPCAARPR